MRDDRGRDFVAGSIPVTLSAEQVQTVKMTDSAALRFSNGVGPALLHEPDILFLDEPTSGADPLARREFWRRITALAEQGVTVIVTTHFMEEAEYCDRVVIIDAGRLLAQGTPAEIRSLAPAGSGREPSMEDAFIAVVQEARRASQHSIAGRTTHD